jgi:hypothetical protein
MEVRNSALSVAGSSCRCTLDSSREPLFYRPRALPPGLLFPPLGPGSNVFRGIGIEFRDRSFFRRLFDIVDIISNDLLCLRVVDHHRFRTRRILFTHGIHREVARLPVSGLALRRRIFISESRPFFGILTLTFGSLVFGDDVGRNSSHCTCGKTDRHGFRCTCSRSPCQTTCQNACTGAKYRPICFR